MNIPEGVTNIDESFVKPTALAILFRCCQHCFTPCRIDDAHTFPCYGVGDGEPCEQGSQRAEDKS